MRADPGIHAVTYTRCNGAEFCPVAPVDQRHGMDPRVKPDDDRTVGAPSHILRRRIGRPRSQYFASLFSKSFALSQSLKALSAGCLALACSNTRK